MNSFIALIEPYARFWPYAVAVVVGGIMALVDRRAIGRPVLLVLLVLIVIGGAVGMNVSPFTFSGGDHYFESLIAMVAAGAAIAGYAIIALASKILGGSAA